MRRVPQPPVNPATRALERHDFWPGLAVTLAGLAVLVVGARHITGVDTTDGSSASEVQLVKAFSTAGVQYADRLPPPPPPNLENVADPTEAMERWANEQADRLPPAWKIRVDISAQAACPT